MALAALSVGAASLALTTPAGAIDTANTGPIDAASGFPAYYTDDSGISLQPCVDGGANCGGATLTSDGAGGDGLSVAPDGEGFYWTLDATLDSTRGSLGIVMAHEGAWASATQPIVFDRMRVRGTLSQPGTYRMLTPYGTTRVEAGAGGIVNQTDDPGCALEAGGACDPKVTNFLRAVNAPVGYLGNSVAETRFTGGTLRNEFVLIAPNGKVIGRQPRAIIMGKLAAGGAALLSSDKVDFGNTKKVAHRSITVKNQGASALALQGIRAVGANTITVDQTGCAARASLASGATCQVNLTYRPGRLKSSAATVVINDDSIAGVHRVPVTAMTSSEFSAQRAVRFHSVKVGSESPTRRIVVTNTGVVPLKIDGSSINGSAAKSFEKRSGAGPLCSKGARVKPGAACALYVGFAPRSFGAKTASLTVRTNAASSPDQVRLTGRGR